METKYKIAISIIAIVIIFAIIGIFLIVIWYRKKIKRNNPNERVKFIGGMSLKEIVDEIKPELDFKLKLLVEIGIYNLTENITHDLNIKTDYHELDIKPTKLKGGNDPDRYIIVNNKRIKLKDYLEELMEKYQLNTEIIKMETTNEDETLRFEEEYEEEEAEFYVEQSLRETERKYNELLDEISTQQELMQNSNVSQEDVEKMNKQIQGFKEIDGKLKLIDTYYDDIFSMRDDLKETTENIKQKRDDILKLIIYVELYYEIEDLKTNPQYVTDDIKFEDDIDIEKIADAYMQQNTFSSCDPASYCECPGDTFSSCGPTNCECPSETIMSLIDANQCDNTCTYDGSCDTFTIIRALQRGTEICRGYTETPISEKKEEDSKTDTMKTSIENHDNTDIIFNKTYISNSFLMDLGNNFSIYDKPMTLDEITKENDLFRFKKRYINPLTKNKYTLKKMNTISSYNAIFKHFRENDSECIFNKQKNDENSNIFNKYLYKFDDL